MNENTTETWFALEVAVAPEAAEAVEFAFNSLESLGTEINHLRKREGELVTVIGYFLTPPDDLTVQDELHYALRIYGMTEDTIHGIVRRSMENTDWLAEWKKHWKPTVIGKFIIAPPWEQISDTDKIVIRIEPNMAFGTGTHETTQLCLTAIEKIYKPEQSFLDVGTGTGILAIAAAKSQPMESAVRAKILACDLDENSVAIAIENAASNGVADRIEFFVGSISENTPRFDFVCANLTIDVIAPILPSLIGKTKGTLVLSGILAEQEASIVSELRKSGLTNPKIERAGEWISVVLPLAK